MFCDQFADAISRAQFDQLHGLAHSLWKAHAAGHIDDATAQGFAEQIEAKKPKRTEPTSFLPPRAKPQRSPDRQASIERRRRLARASPVPPELVGEFTTCEHAVMTILVGEIQKHGVCSRFMDAIAALAGTCRTIVRNTLNKARKFNLLQRQERRRRGQRSLTNIVRIVSPAWRQWLSWIGRRKSRTTIEIDSKSGNARRVDGFGEGLSTAFSPG